METQTKITSAQLSVTLSCNSNYFKVEMGIENPDGLSEDEIDEYRLKAHGLANNAVSDYKISLEAPPQFTKTPSKPFKQVINVNKVPDDNTAEIGIKDNADLSEIAKLPLYTKHKNTK